MNNLIDIDIMISVLKGRKQAHLNEFIEEKDGYERLSISSKCEELDQIIELLNQLKEKEDSKH